MEPYTPKVSTRNICINEKLNIYLGKHENEDKMLANNPQSCLIAHVKVLVIIKY